MCKHNPKPDDRSFPIDNSFNILGVSELFVTNIKQLLLQVGRKNFAVEIRQHITPK